jgi:APA family basic amino acid/polyamine antiporter
MALRRVIGFWEALAVNLGAIIGAGIFVISGVAAGFAGPSAILAIAVGAVIAVLTGLSFVQLSHEYASEGGNYTYARRLLGPYAGIIVGGLFVVASAVGGSLVALSFAGYFASLFGIGMGSVSLIAAAVIVALGAINYFGVKSSADASLVLTVVKIAILAFFVVVGLFFIKPGNYSPFFPSGLGGMFEAAAFVFFAYTGFARVTTIGEEVKDPKRTIPKSIVWSIVISAVIYVLVIAVLVGIAPYQSLAGSQSPLTAAIVEATGNPMFGYIISVGALFATVNVLLSMILAASRVAFTMSRDGNLPSPLKRLNRFGSPDVAVLAATVIMAVSAVAIDFTEVASLSNATALLSYALANVAALKLTLKYRKDPKKLFFGSKWFVLVPVLGVVSAIALIFFLTTLSLELLAILFAIISAYYLISKRVGGAPKKAAGPRPQQRRRS